MIAAGPCPRPAPAATRADAGTPSHGLPTAGALSRVALWGLALALSAGVGGLAGPLPHAAAAAPACQQIASELHGAGVDLRGQDRCPTEPDGGARTGADDQGETAPRRGDEQRAAPAPDPFEWFRTPSCPANRPGGDNGTLCNEALLTCPEPGDVRYVLYRRPRGSADAWARAGVECLTAAEAAVLPGDEGAAAPVVVTAEQFRRLPFAPATAVTQPPGGQLLINLPTPVHALAQVQELPTEVVGAQVTVRATPVEYAWDFGDGATLGPVTDPGAPWPAGPHAHAYLAPGSFAIVLTTTYTGEYSVGGGPWQPIAGTSTVPSPPQPVVAHAARSALVADTLP